MASTQTATVPKPEPKPAETSVPGPVSVPADKPSLIKVQCSIPPKGDEK